MHTYIIRRLLLMIPTLLGITIVVFAVMAASPGGISAQSLIEGQNLEPQAKKALEEYYNRLYGLDSPPPIQYLRWLNNISPVGFTFDDEGRISGFSLVKGSYLGTSFRYGRPVGDLLLERIPITLLLNIITIPLIYAIAIGIGVKAATQRGKPFDIGSGIVLLALWSVPTMLAGVLLIGFFANDQYWHWFPTSGLLSIEAEAMPFLPHWTRFTDILLIFFSMGAGLITFVLVNRLHNAVLRAASMAGAGIFIGIAMGQSLSAPEGVFWSTILALGIGSLFGALAYVDFTGLRVTFFGITGAIIGIVLCVPWLQGEFIRGFLLDRAWHLVLPVICLSYGGFAALAKLTRTAVLENVLADYARTARAKGVPEKQVLWRHVFRNSLLPLITVAASLLPSLLAGSVIVESIFSIEGMGKLAIEAVQTRDRELVLSVTFIGGILTLLGYLLADICYAIADPRVSYD